MSLFKLFDSNCYNQISREAKLGSVHADATTCHQIPFQALIIGLLKDNKNSVIDLVLVSSFMYLEYEQSETQADGAEMKIKIETNFKGSCDCD